jgi:hypothetical protein
VPGGGLAWKGVPFKMADCTYKDSQFAKDSSELAELAKAELTKNNEFKNGLSSAEEFHLIMKTTNIPFPGAVTFIYSTDNI